MNEPYHPKYTHVILCLALATCAALIPSTWLHGWESFIVGGLLLQALLLVFLLVHHTITGNIERLRQSASDLINAVKDVDDTRLKSIGIHFPEWRIKPLDELGNVAYLLEDTSITRDMLIKILTHTETDNVSLAPVRSFPQRNGQQIMASEFHKLAHKKGWAQEWGGSSSSKWNPGWDARRVLMIYGCDDAMPYKNLNDDVELQYQPVED